MNCYHRLTCSPVRAIICCCITSCSLAWRSRSSACVRCWCSAARLCLNSVNSVLSSRHLCSSSAALHMPRQKVYHNMWLVGWLRFYGTFGTNIGADFLYWVPGHNLSRPIIMLGWGFVRGVSGSLNLGVHFPSYSALPNGETSLGPKTL